MRSRQILLSIVILAAFCGPSAAQPKKSKVEVDAPPLESILTGKSTQASPVLSDLNAYRPEMPLGPEDALKAYEIAMSLLANQTSTDFSVIVQAQQANQITREHAEYLLQQRYQIAMMQYQVLSALHDVLKHDIDEALQQSKRSFQAASSDEVLAVPLPDSASAGK